MHIREHIWQYKYICNRPIWTDNIGKPIYHLGPCIYPAAPTYFSAHLLNKILLCHSVQRHNICQGFLRNHKHDRMQVCIFKWLWMVHTLARDIFPPYLPIHPINSLNILFSVLVGFESCLGKFLSQISIHTVTAEPEADLTVAQRAPGPSVHYSCSLECAHWAPGRVSQCRWMETQISWHACFIMEAWCIIYLAGLVKVARM